jgi:hypothetical protein
MHLPALRLPDQTQRYNPNYAPLHRTRTTDDIYIYLSDYLVLADAIYTP